MMIDNIRYPQINQLEPRPSRLEWFGRAAFVLIGLMLIAIQVCFWLRSSQF